MAQVVFVHGVATRSSGDYLREAANRTLLLRSAAFAGIDAAIDNPVWGDLVPTLARGGASFPNAGDDYVGSFSLLGGLAEAAAPQAATGGDLLPGIAATKPDLAVDAIFAALVDDADADGRTLSSDEAAQFVAVARRVGADGFVGALGAAATAGEVVDAMRKAAEVARSFGIDDSLKRAASGLADRARNFASTGLVRMFRDDLNPAVARFIGDVFVYLKPGDVRDRIVERVRGSLLRAHAAKAADESLIVIGHSLGGVILYDMLSAGAAVGLPDDFRVDLLLTVGSQPGLFEEMRLFGESPPPAADGRIPGPDRVGAWLNVYDPVDLFGFRAEPVFAKATDLEFNSVAGLIDAHTTYFKRPGFHARLSARLGALGTR